MQLPIASADDFSRLLDGLGKDLVDASIHLRLYKDLSDAVPEYQREMNESQAFWSLTFAAHWDAALGHLMLAYDQHAASLCLVNLIDTITASPQLGELRASDAPLGGSEALEADRASVTPSDPLVKRLVALRGNLRAHRNAANVIQQGGLELRYGFSAPDAQLLIDRGMRIANTYSRAHRRSTWLTQIVGHDDYRSVLTAVRERGVAIEARIQQEFDELHRRGTA